MAIRDKITVRLKTGGKPHVTEVKRPGGQIKVEPFEGLIRVLEMTRTGKGLAWAAFNPDDVKSIEFERGG